MSDDIVIKTTARFQETQEPIKQRPIIQIDRQTLPNTIRASIDSGRDNPFRPDGKIYKLADPIVDYYKYGPNQSRAQSPTDSQLLLGITENEQEKEKLSKKEKRRRKKEEAQLNGIKKESCWKRLLCCCCCCGLCRGKKEESQVVPASSLGEEKKKNGLELHLDLNDTSQYSSVPAVDSKAKEYKQTKILILKETESPQVKSEENSNKAKESDEKGKETNVKTTRCVIS